MNKFYDTYLPILVLLSELVVLVLLLLRLPTPLRSKFLTQITETNLRVLRPYALSSLVQEVNITTQGLFRGTDTLWISSLSFGPTSVFGFKIDRSFLGTHSILKLFSNIDTIKNMLGFNYLSSSVDTSGTAKTL